MLTWHRHGSHVERVWQFSVDFDKLSVKIQLMSHRNVKSSSSCFVGPKPMVFKHSLVLSWILLRLVLHFVWLLYTCSLNRSLRAWRLMKLLTVRTLDKFQACQIQLSDSRKLQVSALHSSSTKCLDWILSHLLKMLETSRHGWYDSCLLSWLWCTVCSFKFGSHHESTLAFRCD